MSAALLRCGAKTVRAADSPVLVRDYRISSAPSVAAIDAALHGSQDSYTRLRGSNAPKFLHESRASDYMDLECFSFLQGAILPAFCMLVMVP